MLEQIEEFQRVVSTPVLAFLAQTWPILVLGGLLAWIYYWVRVRQGDGSNDSGGGADFDGDGDGGGGD